MSKQNSMDYKNILLKILELIEYRDDKETFIVKFMHVVSLQAIFDLVDSLPSEESAKIKQQLKVVGNDSQKVMDVLNEHFTDEHIQLSLQNAIKNTVSEWIEKIAESLDDSQRQKLQVLAQELKQDNVT